MLVVMTDVTRILSQIEQGDANAAEQLLPLVYDELRKLAAAKMAQEKPGQTLQATALVHDAYLRLVNVDKGQHWDSRGHFFSAAAEAMRRILVDTARRKKNNRNGGDLIRREFDASVLAAPEASDDLLALNDALEKLEKTDPQSVELVNLRVFAGLTGQEAATATGIAPRTADRIWAYARAWLIQEIQGDN
jgi:RNA polymerase sigma factor (TIGR02999 family)